jgi:hypothetical protein
MTQTLCLRILIYPLIPGNQREGQPIEKASVISLPGKCKLSVIIRQSFNTNGHMDIYQWLYGHIPM